MAARRGEEDASARQKCAVRCDDGGALECGKTTTNEREEKEKRKKEAKNEQRERERERERKKEKAEDCGKGWSGGDSSMERTEKRSGR